MQDKQTVHQQLPLFLIRPPDRSRGWIQYGDRVIVLVFEGDKITGRTGFICSTPGSHAFADNVRTTIVWHDRPRNELADNADDAHEQSFKIGDPNLLKLEEAEILKDPDGAAAFFKGIHAPEVARKISALLSAPIPAERAVSFNHLVGETHWWK